jgi:Zn/Cd-binding protein ZinT
MLAYRSTGGKSSGVDAFKISPDSITVKFKNGANYLYTYTSAGKKIIELMKSLAQANHGLSTFISQNKPKYQRKF